MQFIALAVALLLLLALATLGRRAQRYVHQHPELLVKSLAESYRRCQITLRQVIERSKEIGPEGSDRALIAWHAPNGSVYTLSGTGIEERLSSGRAHALPWENIGGVGVRMQPGFKLVDTNRDGVTDLQRTTGYSFLLLIVPLSGSTITIPIPTYERPDAVDFVAQTLALAARKRKRINVFGFDKPPAPRLKRVRKY